MRHLPFNHTKTMCGTPLKSLKLTELTITPASCDCEQCLAAEEQMIDIDIDTQATMSKLRFERLKKYNAIPLRN